MLMALPEMEKVHAAMIYLKCKDYLEKKKFWMNIVHEAEKVEKRCDDLQYRC